MGRLSVQALLDRVQWEGNRLWRKACRRLAAPWWLMLACLPVSAAAVLLILRLPAEAPAPDRSRAPVALAPVIASDSLEARERLRAFDRYLLPQKDIPLFIDALIKLAATYGLTLERGQYQAQADVAGGFLRYRMALPIRGDARAVQGFIEAALIDHRSLTLEAVQFKREQVESATMAADIHWVLFLHPAASGSAP